MSKLKTLIIGNRDRYEKYLPEDSEIAHTSEKYFCDRGATDEEILNTCKDADFIAADPMTVISGDVIRQMPNLKVIHSEGVAFNFFDLEVAKKCGVYVCNCKGINAGAVAEQAIMLMLQLLRNAIVNDRAVREGRQIQIKERTMVEGMAELSDMKIGLIGLGDIGMATAERLVAFGPKVYYNSRHRRSESVELDLNIKYRSIDEILETCDIISLHTAVTPETKEMVNDDFFARMKTGAYLVNTARGDLVDNEALIRALKSGQLGGAGLDTLSPEPVLADNQVLNMPEKCLEKVIFSPHIEGITTDTFLRSHSLIWESFDDVMKGKKPINVVNGL